MSKRLDEIEAIEIDLLLEAIYRWYGYDFREYSRASLGRRVRNAIRAEGLATVSGLQERVLHEPACMERFLAALSVTVTSFFRDPGFFLAFRHQVVPLLRTYPFIRIWHAGCATGEEVYSLAILLQEERLYDRCRIYATDLNPVVLRQAREGIFPMSSLEESADRYERAGGTASFGDYYTTGYGSAIFRSSLREKVLFSAHNLAMDNSFNEFNVILCRNVMIYFQRALQERVHRLLYDSLATFGVLGLGSKESLQFTPHEEAYRLLVPAWKLYRRVC